MALVGTPLPVKFDPLIEEWFRNRFEAPTPPQIAGWPVIRSGSDLLLCAPTGSGKTLAAFLSALNEIVRAAREGLEERTRVLYVSPLKALVNDVHKNLELPLSEIREIAGSSGMQLAEIRVALRTGDTPRGDRARMIRKAPHILVTTPESLFILLTAARSRELFRSITTVIIDEIHAVIESKRGPHLALSLARLDALVSQSESRPPQRIGLSATVRPVAEVARFLAGANRPAPEIVDIGHRREMDLSVWVPKDPLGPIASAGMWGEIYDHVAETIRSHRTTLVFVGTRRLSERVTHNLLSRLGEGSVMPHHGSLSRRIRLETENRLKSGELRAVVATASLELGIDIGSVDRVIQIGSPRSIVTALQRVGRSGHWIGAMPSGVFIPTTRDELVECAALVRAIRSGALDNLTPIHAPLDILAQQIVAACAADEWKEEELFAMIRSAHPYRGLSRRDFESVISMLSDGVATSRGRAGALLHRDRVNGRLRGRRGARLAAIAGGGAIPDATTYAVVAEPESIVVGTVDEDFAVESISGDIFLLGTRSWKIKRVEQGRVRVEDAHGAPPSIPFWNGEAPGRTLELSREVSRLRSRIDALSTRERAEGVAALTGECGVDRFGAEQMLDYIAAGKAGLGAVPTQDCVIAERFFDESGGMQLVIHAPFGARINRAWGLALRKRFCRSFNLELQAAATDNGIVISLSEQHAFPLEIVFQFLKTASVREVLTQAVLPSPMFTSRWRWNAQRALIIPRFRGGRKVPAPIQRMKADDLMAAVFPDQAACPENLTGEVRIPDHPLVNETISNCLHEAMDLDGLVAILQRLESGSLRTVAMDTASPSLFCHEILSANPYAYLDDAPLEERRARAVQLRSTLRADVSGGAGVLDPEAIVAVAAEVRPVVRSADELHDALLTLVLAPPEPAWRDYFGTLAAGRRAALLVATREGRKVNLWVTAEKLDAARAIHPDASLRPEIESIPSPRSYEDPDSAVAEAVSGWLLCNGPLTTRDLSDRIGVDPSRIARALLRLEAEGQVLSGRFSSGSPDSPIEYCNRNVLARIHRLTLGRLRREIEPVSTADYQEFVKRWQHTAPGTRLHGVDGTLQIVKQLQGMEFPAEAWEREVLPQRIAGYRPEYLDKLCASGEVMWGRLSPHPAARRRRTARHPVFQHFGDSRPHPAARRRRVRPTRAAPVSLFLRECAGWLVRPCRDDARDLLSHPARDVLAALERCGASFFTELARESGRLASEVEDGLWELVSAGLVTADGFDNLRALIDPKRRLALGRNNPRRPRNAPGRWALLRARASPRDAEAFARQLLLRLGVVFRDAAKEESVAPPWRDLLVTLRKLEAQGEIRGGHFVSGFAGEQFALPEAVDLLRSVVRDRAHSGL